MMALIGFSVGFVGFLLHQIIEWLTDIRIERSREYLAVGLVKVDSLYTYVVLSSLANNKSLLKGLTEIYIP